MTKTNKGIDYGKAFGKLKGNKSSHHINGFWFHINWDGDKGIDQHGREWTNRNEPTCKKLPVIEAITRTTKDLLELKSKLSNQ